MDFFALMLISKNVGNIVYLERGFWSLPTFVPEVGVSVPRSSWACLEQSSFPGEGNLVSVGGGDHFLSLPPTFSFCCQMLGLLWTPLATFSFQSIHRYLPEPQPWERTAMLLLGIMLQL